ncbi:hypothetical protein BAY61_30130 [Prauserella marina]|uniref:Predicted lipoprotein with conserved Yx(FWY)xxD motif n=1 Tax=Prauserella marina TaxID=530584 RepID=A0A222VXW1_9PSEU|nr:hypothetical protein [Prauserella marina]ASR38551.1 hypothetical protein BAY61_30130 [Prauserella marina]PWV81861.1 putative lipoprotein with Yx(FWY)xxD motif [Prauserella marina]SDD14042.1 Predicted lipoprotein with conserved Yx(FWY)xxD motif [Prauserella marina]
MGSTLLGRTIGSKTGRANRTVLAASAGVMAVAFAAAACGGGGGQEPETGGPATGSPVSAVDHGDLDQVLVDNAGMTLYASSEEAGRIGCVDGCLAIWKPLTIKPGTTLSGDAGLADGLATVTRPDTGATQVTYQGYPLYTFTQDSAAGDLKGDNVKDSFGSMSFTWHTMTQAGFADATPPSSPAPETGSPYGY